VKLELESEPSRGRNQVVTKDNVHRNSRRR